MAKRKDSEIQGDKPTVDAWRPDWRQENGYPTESATNTEWAWEFLRRSELYQNLYDELIAPFLNPETKYFETDQAIESFKASPHVKEISDQEIDILSFMKFFRKKFSVDFTLALPSSYKEKNVSRFFYLLHESGWSYERPAEMREDEIYKVEIELEANRVCCVFDISVPIPPQIEKFENYLEELQEQARYKKRKSKYAHYKSHLRILDAYHEGASILEIAAVIFPGTDNLHPEFAGNRIVKERYEAAQKMCSDGYKYLYFSKS